MGSEWKTTTLGEVLELKRGYDLPQTQRTRGAVHVISSSGVTDTHGEAKVPGPGVVTGRYGTIGQVFYSESDFWPLNTTLYVRDFKGNDAKFVYYFLKTIDYSQYSDKAAVPGVNRNHLHMATVVVPTNLNVQRRIAHILGSLDDKIELNRQMNETLESMAQALFKSWFVDFDPVIDNAIAAGNPIPEPLQARAAARKKLAGSRKPLPQNIQKQFPDRFVETGELGWVPEGWEAGTLGDVLELAYGKSLPATKRKCGSVPVYGSGGLSGFHDECLVKGPGIVVGRKGTVGSLYWVDDDFFPIDTVFYVVSKSAVPLTWLYQSLLLMDIKSLGADSAVPGVNRNAVYTIPLVIAPPALQEHFLLNAYPTISRLQETNRQTKSLSSLRDALLPKLLSGQIRIPDAEKLIAGAV